MNKISKRYMSDVKSFFPIMGKEERRYIKKLTDNVNEFCEEANVTSKETLYKDFGLPNEIANTYFSSKEITYLLKRMRISKYVKRGVLALTIIALIAVSIFGISTYHAYKIFEEQEVIFQEFTIE